MTCTCIVYCTCVLPTQIPDQDLEARRTKQLVDPISNKIFIPSLHSFESKNVDTSSTEEEDDDEDVEDIPETDSQDFFTKDLVISILCFIVVLCTESIVSDFPHRLGWMILKSQLQQKSSKVDLFKEVLIWNQRCGKTYESTKKKCSLRLRY